VQRVLQAGIANLARLADLLRFPAVLTGVLRKKYVSDVDLGAQSFFAPRFFVGVLDDRFGFLAGPPLWALHLSGHATVT
jgi:hypothetical protein